MATTYTLDPPTAASPTTTGAPPAGGGQGDILYWQGYDPKTGGYTSGATDPSQLTNPVPVYRTQPGQKPQEGGGGQGPSKGVSYTLDPPSAPAGAPAAPSPMVGAPPPPVPATQPAQQAQLPVGGVVPMPQQMPAPAQTPAPAPIQGPPGVASGMHFIPQGQPGQVGAPMRAIPQAPSPVPTTGQPPPSPDPGWGHTLGLVAAKGLEGVPLTLAGAYDLPAWAINAGLGVAGVQSQLPYLGPQIERGYQALGLPEPQTSGEQITSDVASALGGTIGTMGIGGLLGLAGKAPRLAQALTAMKGRQLLSAAGAGGGSALGQQAGLGPTGTAVTSILGALAGHGAGTAGLTGIRAVQAARQAPGAIVGQQIARSAAQPGALATNLANPPVRGLRGAPMTTAMVTRDPRLMMLEKALRETPEGHGIRAVEAGRAGAISQALGGLRRTPGLTEGQRGQLIRRVLQDNERTLGQRTDQLYDRARAGTGTYNIEPMRNHLQATVQKYYGPGSGGAPAPFTSIARQILQRGTTASNEWLIGMDRQIGDAARMAGRAGDNTQAAALGEMRRELDKIHGSPELAAARRWRASVGNVMGHDATGAKATGDILKETQFGNPRMPDDQVARRAVQNEASVRQVLRASDEAIAAARANGASSAEIARITAQGAAVRTVMREQFLDRAAEAHLSGDVSTYTQGGIPTTYNVMSPAKWEKFWQANGGTADHLFSPAERDTLRRITDMLADDATVSRTAASQGSSTARNLTHLGLKNPTVGNVLTRVTQGRVAPDSAVGRLMITGIERFLPMVIGAHWFGPAGAVIGHHIVAPSLDAFLEHRDEMVRALLSDAMADPQLARQFLSQGNAANIAQAMARSRQTGGKLWGLIRRLIPITGATEQQANQPPLH